MGIGGNGGFGRHGWCSSWNQVYAADSAGVVSAWSCGVRLALIVGDRRLDGVLGQHRAMHLHRRQRQLLGDGGVLDFERLTRVLPLSHSVTSELEAMAEPQP